MVFGFIMTWVALQFWFIFSHWQINTIYALTFAIASLILTVTWMPESPRYLYGQK